MVKLVVRRIIRSANPKAANILDHMRLRDYVTKWNRQADVIPMILEVTDDIAQAYMEFDSDEDAIAYKLAHL